MDNRLKDISIELEPEVETMTGFEVSATRKATGNVGDARVTGVGGAVRPAGPPAASETACGPTSTTPVSRRGAIP
jgi:hypothetical protein